MIETVSWQEICEKYSNVMNSSKLMTVIKAQSGLGVNLDITIKEKNAKRGDQYNTKIGDACLEWTTGGDTTYIQDINTKNVENSGPLLVLGTIYFAEKNKLFDKTSVFRIVSTGTDGQKFFAKFLGFKKIKPFVKYVEENKGGAEGDDSLRNIWIPKKVFLGLVDGVWKSKKGGLK